MPAILRKGISFVEHKLLDGWRERSAAPAFSETRLIALKPVILAFSPFFISLGYRAEQLSFTAPIV